MTLGRVSRNYPPSRDIRISENWHLRVSRQWFSVMRSLYKYMKACRDGCSRSSHNRNGLPAATTAMVKGSPQRMLRACTAADRATAPRLIP